MRAVQFIVILAFSIFILGGMVWCAAYRVAERKRSALFAARETIDFDRWFERFYIDSDRLDRASVLQVLTAISIAIDVFPTQLLPTDCVDDLGVKNRWLIDDSQELLEEYLTEYLAFPVRLSSEVRTIDDIIRLYGKQRTDQRGQASLMSPQDSIDER